MLYIEARTLLERGRIEITENRAQGEATLREALGITETIQNCKHLKIQILNELYPYFSQDERAKWDRELESMGPSSAQWRNEKGWIS